MMTSNNGKYTRNTKTTRTGKQIASNNMDDAHVNAPLTEFVELTAFCRDNDIDHERVRELARRGQMPNTKQIFGTWVIHTSMDVDAIAAVLDEYATTARSRRDDGRTRRGVYMTNAEWELFQSEFMSQHNIPADAIVTAKPKTTDK